MKVERLEVASVNKSELLNYARKISDSEFFHAIERVDYLGGGSFGRAIGVTHSTRETTVIKFLLVKDILDNEVASLKLLGQACPVPMPTVLTHSKANNVIPVDYYAMTCIPGKPSINCPRLYRSKKYRNAFKEEVITALHAIHEHKSDKFGNVDNPIYDNWLDYYKPFAEAVIIKARELYKNGKLSGKVLGAMEMAWSKFDVIFSEEVKEACLIHGDLHTANIMVDKCGKVTGFIDPWHTMYADREFDLLQFNNLNKGWGLADAYVKKY
ncbi:MAG: aminoglycoside phosphotransferase family protein, partial [Clostridia bacterium]|nr:aminoglycoside phosphotransferase family protein [Clostridia bacterium]